MGHNLNFNEHTGRYSFFTVQQKAWHNLGQVVTGYPTSAEAIRHAGLDYEVIKSPLYTNGKGIAVNTAGDITEAAPVLLPEHFATLRTDTGKVLGVVGKDYQIVQNREAFAFFDAIVGGGAGIMYETAGALGNGQRIFITAKLPDYIRVGGGDDITEKYIFLTTSHDGSGSITAAFTPVRVVCQNTLNAALGNLSNLVRIRHTSGAPQRVADAHRIMGLAHKMGGQLEGIFNRWAKVRITDGGLKELIRQALCPNKETFEALRTGASEKLSAVFRNSVEDAFSYAMMADTQQMDTTKGTVFGAYNAVTGYFQNMKRYRDSGSKLESIIGGTAQLKSQKAFDLCTSFASHGEEALRLN